MEGEPDDILKALAAGKVTSSHSRLTAWLRQNREAFDAQLTAKRQSGRIDWKLIAERFEQGGMTGLKPETIRKAWLRIQGPSRPRRPATPPEPPAVAVAAPVPSQPTTSEGTPDERHGSGPSRFRFKPEATEGDRSRLVGRGDKPK